MKAIKISFRRLILICLSVFYLSVFTLSQKNNPTNSLKRGHSELKITMTDGINLSTDVYLPKEKGKFPVVLVRTPYNKYAEEWMGKAFNMFDIAVVIQDVRGKYQSEGEYYPFINERKDGLETLRWIREQDWSNKTVAGWGGSYVGFTQWAISDSLDFLTLLLTGANLYDFVYPDGLFSLQSAFVWGFQNASDTANLIKPEKMIAGSMMLPLSLADDSTIKDIPFINDWLQNESYNEYWQKLDFRGKTRAPLISIAGWQDIFLLSQIKDFQALLEKGNKDNRLIIGPWCHGSLGEPNEYGGLKKTGKPTKIFKYVKNFLKENENELTSPFKNSKYNLFIMEKNEYVGSDVWPPKETKNTPYYIGPNGYLGNTKYAENGKLEYKYNPADPFRSYGGTALGEKVGPARQNANINRIDQLTFEMPVNENPFILLGPITASLWLSSNTPCTDFIVQLQDVFPDGKIINIQEGGAKVKFDNDLPKKTEISVWATGYQINPGHKLRVVISSSWFPRYNRNLNTCEPIANAVNMSVANQTVYFGTDTPSSINLPVYEISDKKRK